MNQWQQQNQAVWERIALAMPLRGLTWITCDRYVQRHALIAEFATRFPDGHHVCTTGWGYEENYFSPSNWTHEKLSLEAFFKLHFELNGGQFDGKPAVLHITAVDGYLPGKGRRSEFPTGEFMRDLEKQWESVCANLPFALVFWSGTSGFKDARLRMPRLVGGLSNRIHFDSKPFETKGIDVWICHFSWGNLGSFPNLDLTYTKLWTAYQLAQQGKLFQARQRISEALRLAEVDHDALTEGRCQVALGKGYMLDGDYEAAIEWLSEGIMTHILDHEGEDADEAIAVLAQLLTTLERYEEAAIFLIEAYNRGGEYGWTPREGIRAQFSIVLQKLVPERKQEVLMLLYDRGFRLGETDIDGAQFTDRYPWR